MKIAVARRASAVLNARSLPFAAGLAAYVTVLGKWRGVVSEPDTLWHVAVGRWIIAHGAVPHHDMFSYTMRGAPWVPHEWLAEVVIAWTYGKLGWAGLVVAAALAFGAAITLLVRALLRYVPPAYALVGAIGAWGLCMPHLYARPHVFTFPLLVLWGACLVAARAAGRAPPPWAAIIMLLWANLHGGYMFGLGLAALFAGEAAFEAPNPRAAIRVVRDWGIFGALSLLAALVTPNGISGLLLPFDLLRMNSVMATIQEWRSPNFQQPQPLEAWLLLVLLGTLYFGVRLPITRIVMLLVLVHLALAHLRNGEIVGLIGPLIVAPALGAKRVRSPGPGGPVPQWQDFAGRSAPPIVAAAAVGIVLASAWAAIRIGIADNATRFAPADAIAYVKARKISGPVFNDYAFGGYLIFVGIPTFIDGRADMYGDDFFKRQRDIADLTALLAKYHVTWTLLEPQNPEIVLLDHLPGWRRIYSDGIAVVHARTDTIPPPATAR